MKYCAKETVGTTLILILLMSLGCAPAKTIWTTEPEAGISSNSYFQATFVPLKQDRAFFTAFRIEIKNLTRDNLAIDWNNTLYIHNNRKSGMFVFGGINPESVKNRTIPTDKVAPGETFSKVIVPFKMLSIAPLRDTGESSGIRGGILPSGESGIQLVVLRGEEKVVEFLKVSITERVAPG